MTSGDHDRIVASLKEGCFEIADQPTRSTLTLLAMSNFEDDKSRAISLAEAVFQASHDALECARDIAKMRISNWDKLVVLKSNTLWAIFLRIA